MRQIRIGLIGAGYMGKAHAIAFGGLSAVLAPPVPVIGEMLAEVGQPKKLEQELEQ